MRSSASFEHHLYENSEAQPSRRESSASTQQVLEVDPAVKVDLKEIEKVNAVHSQGSPDDFFLDTQSMGLPNWPSVIPSLELDSEWCKDTGPFPESTYISPALTTLSSIPKSASTSCPIDTSISPMELGSQAMTPQLQPFHLPVQLLPLERSDLDDLFFARAYSFAPILFTLLHYALRTLAASMGTQFHGVLPLLYTHTCCLLDVAGRCFHLVHLVKLDQIDNPNSWQASSLPWVKIEERRRTFWTAYALDYANLANDPHPPTAHETSFRYQQAVTIEYLAPAMAKKDDQQLSPYAKSIVMPTILARCLSHLNQCNVERILDPTCQKYIARHGALDTILSHEVQTTLSSAAAGFYPCDPTILFTDMLAQTAVLVLFTSLKLPLKPQTCTSTCTEATRPRVLGQAQKLSQIGSFQASLVSHEYSSTSNPKIRMLGLELQRDLEIVPAAIGF
ncbi:hypothetical protein BDV30DRAFT_225094 [Aspergillus minisclerotigenes]|uniref:Transcription factor domain-containing protein n=1 Tax=Aspergillus minisclerotigenes TaxID=656917 RepID=A0A5N6J969_9EURO|nr:hypothetical protein BDV30DRAFT_225094 [Aspergillus minisclerotigenes]